MHDIFSWLEEKNSCQTKMNTDSGKFRKSKLDIDIWGPNAWTFLHAVTFAYPNSPSKLERQHFFSFFQQVGNVLPCAICSKHFKGHMNHIYDSKHEVFDNKTTLSKWLVNVHNDVNIRNGKRIIPYHEVVQDYWHPSVYPDNIFKKMNSYILYPILIIIILLCFLSCAFAIKIGCKKYRMQEIQDA